MKNIVGSVYEGEVVLKEGNYYLVDIGIGFDVILNKEEAIGELNVGDIVNVIVAYYVKDDIFVSMKGVNRKKHIEELEAMVGSDNIVKGKVVAFKNKRFIVDLGDNVKGSVYVKNMDTKYIDEGNEYLNQEYDFLVKSRSYKGFEDFELTRRELISQQENQAREDFKEKFQLGQVVDGKVIETNKSGIILDVDGYNCFIPRSEISYKLNKELPEIGSEHQAIIKEIQMRSLSLKGSIKELLPHPFDQVKDVKVGDILKGKISKVADYGLFVEVFDDVNGLVHISEISYSHTKDLSGWQPDQEVDVRVIGIDNDKNKLALSIKKLLPSPYEKLKEKINVGDKISVTVKRVTENGLRVLVMDDYYTTIINEDIYDFTKIKPTLRVNDRLEAVVMELDDENEKVVLSNEEFVKGEYELLDSSI